MKRINTVIIVVLVTVRWDRKYQGGLRPKSPKIKRQLSVMLDGQKVEPVAPDQIEDDVVIHNKLPEIISFAKRGIKTVHQYLSF